MRDKTTWRSGRGHYNWKPFQPNAGGFNLEWWEWRQSDLDNPWYIQVVDDEGVEVARIELDDKGIDTTSFVSLPILELTFQKVQAFVVE